MRPSPFNAWGIELEGAWDDEPDESDRLREDGSVRCQGEYFSCGELPSRPLRTLSELRSFLDGNYPDQIDVSCGMHVHISFTRLAYVDLLAEDSAFETFLVRRLERWGRKRNVRAPGFWTRLRGDNGYCGFGWNAESLAGADANRYIMVNFRSYARHGTVELRLLPMFGSAHAAYRAIVALLAIVSMYIRRNRNRLGRPCTVAAVLEGASEAQPETLTVNV